jgi:cytochrome c6
MKMNDGQTPTKMRARAAWIAALLLMSTPATAAGSKDEKSDFELGRKVFTQIAQPQCGVCHTLAAAGTSGAIGPKLDELQPNEERVRNAVRQGVGIMPAYEKKLTEAQIRAVARYVARAVKAAR